jgi:toxin ParE1/3/4
MNKYRFTRTARKELKAIKDYIAAQSLQAAFRFVDEVTQKCRTLAQFPEMGRLWHDLVPPLRSFPVDRYLIFYRPVKDGIEVIRVISGYQDLTAIFPELGEGENVVEDDLDY